MRPVVAQWDRLSRIWCYMLILPGPAKVDLLFGGFRAADPALELVSAGSLPLAPDE